jgi:predicted TIM-barrel fold metal-dependent hydrolase
MEVVDAQLHSWEPDRPERPWDTGYGRSNAVEARNRAHHAAHPVGYEDLLEWMDRAGVDGALLVTSAVYGGDNSYPLEAAARHPDRFGVVGRVDPAAADLEETVAGWRERGLLGIRLIIGSDAERATLRSGGFDRLFRACSTHAVPICVFPPGILSELAPLAESLPGLSLVIDHLGLSQPPLMDAEADPFGRLPELLALARHPNVAVKLTALPVLSSEPFPFLDLWPHLHRVLAAFGPERVIWGSDATRTAGLHSYEEAVAYIRDSAELSAADKELILGASLRRIFDWTL